MTKGPGNDRMTNSEKEQRSVVFPHSCFVIDSLFVIRASSFA